MVALSAWRVVAIALSLLLAAGCGYVRSGEWIDDPGNWSRALKSTKPPDVVVRHSRYWRAPHFTFEAGYEFEIAPNAALRDQLFRENRLARVDSTRVDVRTLCFSGCPAWFAPGPTDSYEIWTYADEPENHFRVLIDRHTGTIFLVDYQI